VTSTLGVVWTSRFSHALVSSLQVSLDWYRIETYKAYQRPQSEVTGNASDAAPMS